MSVFKTLSTNYLIPLNFKMQFNVKFLFFLNLIPNRIINWQMLQQQFDVQCLMQILRAIFSYIVLCYFLIVLSTGCCGILMTIEHFYICNRQCTVGQSDNLSVKRIIIVAQNLLFSMISKVLTCVKLKVHRKS